MFLITLFFFIASHSLARYQRLGFFQKIDLVKGQTLVTSWFELGLGLNCQCFGTHGKVHHLAFT